MLTTTVTEPADSGTATAAQVWARLGTAIEAANLPTPDSIIVGHRALILLHDSCGHTLTDLHTWIAWLGAHGLKTKTYNSSRPGHLQRDTSAKATWRGWNIEVVLIEVAPAHPIEAFKRRVEAHRAAGHRGGVGGCKACPTPGGGGES